MASTFVEMHGGMPVTKELIVDNDELMEALAEAAEAHKKREREEEHKDGQPLKKVRRDDIREEPCKDQGQKMPSTFVEMHGGMPVIKELIVDNDELMEALAEAGEASKKREREEECKDGQPLKKVRRNDAREEPCKDQDKSRGPIIVRIKLHKKGYAVKEPCKDHCKDQVARIELHKENKESSKTVVRAIKPCNTARKASQQRRSLKVLETSASMKIECEPVKKVLNASSKDQVEPHAHHHSHMIFVNVAK
ncbi:hypothetical protein SELMODRAFT_408256 [Selaginella moellendorffii]|uniref:Uncharacterized protein n=1 Tax=Selaginella moellendorffii TaxID=88036 RepID=D8R7Q3_SELML|nr:hypothetical protein SELMODRAFT_408256 [Selaginella moellendorffii]